MRAMRYVVFGVNIGNLGRSHREVRPSSADLCRRWNAIFGKQHIPFTLRHAYRGTGNFFLTVDGEWSVARVSEALRVATNRGFAIFAEAEYLNLVVDLEQAFAQESLPGRRSTPGAVMDTNPSGGIPPTLSSKGTAVPGGLVRPRVRSVWKFDRLRPDGKALDPSVSARDGGWGAIARAMKREHGGGT
jgi:hypothetical protein